MLPFLTDRISEHFVNVRQDITDGRPMATYSVYSFIILLTVSVLLTEGNGIVHSQSYPKLFSEITFSNNTELADEQRALLSQKNKIERNNPAVVRSRYVQVNLDILYTERQIMFNFFEDTELLTTRISVSDQTSEQFTWVGVIAGESGGTVTLVREKESLVGNVRIGNLWYEIRAIGRGLHTVREIDPTKFPDEEQPLLVP